MTQRIFVTVDRGMTDKTPVCIYPWEKVLLEMIHGSVVEHSIEELSTLKEAAKIEKMRMNHGAYYAPSLRESLINMAIVDPEEDPVLNPEAEYARLSEKYGLDKDVPMAVVTRAYGEFHSKNFERALKEFSQMTPHGELVRGRPEKAGGTKRVHESAAQQA